MLVSVHAGLLVVVVGLVLNIIRNWRREVKNRRLMAVRAGTYFDYVDRDLKLLFFLLIAYVLAAPLLFGFVKISLY